MATTVIMEIRSIFKTLCANCHRLKTRIGRSITGRSIMEIYMDRLEAIKSQGTFTFDSVWGLQ